MGNTRDDDEARAAEWASADRTVADGVPTPVEADRTPRPEVTGRHNTLTPAAFASAIDLTDRDAFARGVEHGRKVERAAAAADAVTEHRKVREDVIETVRALFVIFELQYPEWPAAEEWIRRRLTPL